MLFHDTGPEMRMRFGMVQEYRRKWCHAGAVWLKSASDGRVF